MKLDQKRFSVGQIFLLLFGVASAFTLLTGPTASARLIGWIGLTLYLLLKRQRSLFWIHLSVPICLGAFALVMTDHAADLAHENIFDEAISTDDWLPLFVHYLSDAGFFMSILTYPFSFLGVDP